MSDCYYDEAGCLICPEQAAQPYIPARIEKRPVLAWNAGANSITTRDGGMRVKFTQPLGVIGAIIGFKSGRTHQTVPGLVEHGWYFQNVGGVDLVQPIESGKVLGMPIAGRTDDTLFEIRRVDGVVRYVMDGVVVRVSDVNSIGHKVVNCCLFASGDSASGGSGGGGAINAVQGNNGAIESGIPILLNTPDNPDWVDDAYWSIEVPQGGSLDVILDDPHGDFAAVDGYLLVGSSAQAGDLAADDTSPFHATLDSLDAGTYYISLDVDVAVSGLTLTATVTGT